MVQVIRNEALLLLTYLTREAEVIVLSEDIADLKSLLLFYLLLIFHHAFIFQEIQKIVVFEGAFEKIFGIIREEGGSEGGVVVQVFEYLVYIYENFLLLLHKSFFVVFFVIAYQQS